MIIKQVGRGLAMTITSFAVANQHKRLFFVAAIPPLLALLAGFGLYKLALTNLFITLKSTFLTAFLLTFGASSIGLIVVNVVYASLVVYFSKVTKNRPWKDIIAASVPTQWSRVVAWSFLGALIGTILTSSGELLPSASRLHWIIEALNYLWWVLTFLMIPLLIDEENTIIHGLKLAINILHKNFGLIISSTASLMIIKSFVGWHLTKLAVLAPRLIFQYNIITIRPSLSTLSFAIMFSGMASSAVISVIMTLAETALAAGVYRTSIGKPLPTFERPNLVQLILISVTTLLAIALTASVVSFVTMFIELKIPFFQPPTMM
ncbi:hypothetical protein JW872_00740 [Candidatus Babeliales bacterium]|nr:hypothetical protein [Candidatus Babeliales bacterium]